MRAATLRKTAMLATLLCLAAGLVWTKKKKTEDETQTLQLPKELPNAVTGETRHLTFHVTPLSAKGLLSQQIRDALKALEHQAGSDTVLEIRAFVAGSGDLRRVRDLISETYTDRKLPLPATTIVQTGGLPLNGAQVVLEAVAAARKEVHTGGLAWIPALPATAESPLAPVEPLAQTSLDSLRDALRAAGSEPGAVLRITCFLSAFDNLEPIRSRVAADYPRAAVNYVQTQREPPHAVAACEAVAAAGSGTPRLEFRNLGQGARAALVGSSHLVLTSAQTSFGYQEADTRLAFERFGKILDEAGVSWKDSALVRFYPLSERMADQVRQVRSGFFDASRLPAASLALFEGLSSQDAAFAVDAVAVKD
jgi:enamine deaminase RidA (YjgF/YER057c/UK114 family)